MKAFPCHIYNDKHDTVIVLHPDGTWSGDKMEFVEWLEDMPLGKEIAMHWLIAASLRPENERK